MLEGVEMIIKKERHENDIYCSTIQESVHTLK